MRLGAAATLALAACAAAPCDRDAKARKWHEAAVSCRDAYRKNPTPEAANELMNALYYDDQDGEAALVAATLLTSAFAGPAHRVLGDLAQRKGDGRSAAIHLGMAVSLDAVRGDQKGLARDAFALAGVHVQNGQFAAAMADAAVCRDAATRANDHQMVMYAEVARGDILGYTGDYGAAERVLSSARELATGPADRALAEFKLGILYITAGPEVFAASHLNSAASLSVGRSEMAMFRPAIELNLAWLAWRAGRLDEATAHLDTAEATGADRAIALAIRGDVELARGAPDRAAALLASAEAAAPQRDYGWYVPYRRAVMEERRGSLDDAERAYRRSIAAVEELRAGSGTYEGYVIESYRVPYQRLIGLLAARGRWRDALEVVSRLDSGAMITAAAGSDDLAPGADSGGQTLHRPGARPAAPSPATAVTVGADRLLAAWRGRHLLVIVPAGEQMWQLDVSDGEVTGRAVGPVAAVESLAARLEERPDDEEAGRGLADALLPQPPGRDPLDLLLVGPVARAPLAALRDRHGLIAARRVLSRVLGLRRLAGVPVGTGPALVIGDSRGDLPAAASEARWVADRLRARLRLGPEATRAALATGGGAALLHLAVHGELREDAPVLLLADGQWTPADVANLRPAPRYVVLASCASAAARDQGGWSSFAAAFLASGTETVVATQWSVTDEDSAALVRAFYEQGGATSPAAALAAAQAGLSRTRPARGWAAFTVVAAPPIVP